MKRINVLFMTLLLTTGAMQSQVKIGENAAPEKGVILDLNAPSQYTGGLLLPNVDITDLGKIPTTFTDKDVTVAGADQNQNLTGMIVWNIGTVTDPGVYAWDGENWKVLYSCPTPAVPGAMTLSAAATGQGGTITASVPEVPGATGYKWTLPAGLTGNGSTTNSIVITGASVGAYPIGSITVAAVNDCGPGATSGNLAAVIVDPCTVAGMPQITTMTVSGKDTAIALNEAITITASVVADAIAYHWILPAGLTAPSLTTSIPSITVTGTADNYNTPVRIRVAAENTCGTGSYSTSSKYITVYDGCGAYTAAGVWRQFMCYNLGAVENGQPFTPSWELNGAYYMWGQPNVIKLSLILLVCN